jgi:hypothetical protein
VACSDESLPFAPTTDTELPELAAAMDAAPAAHSANVGYYRITSGAGHPNMVAAITTGGHTPVLLNNVAVIRPCS